MPNDATQSRSGATAPSADVPPCDGRPLRLCSLTTVGSSIRVHYQGRLEYFASHGFDVTVVCAPSEFDAAIRAHGLRLVTIPMERAIRPWRDLHALGRIWRFLRRERFDIVEVGMPKAALLGSIAARLAGVPCLIHLLHGLAYEGQRGLVGRLVRWSTAVPCRLADQTFAVGPSVRERMHQDGVCERTRVGVLGHGSCNGVDVQRFSPSQRRLGADIRERYQIPRNAIVVGYVGRLAGDKGMIELSAAVRELAGRVPELILLLVGPYDQRDLLSPEVVNFLTTCGQVRKVGWQADAVPFYAAMDIFVLPTYREGLPAALLEAAAMELPTITTDATGARDAVQDGVTGIRVPVGDSAALAAAMERLATDADLRRAMGVAGRRWVEEHFEQQRIWALYAENYRRLGQQRR